MTLIAIPLFRPYGGTVTLYTCGCYAYENGPFAGINCQQHRSSLTEDMVDDIWEVPVAGWGQFRYRLPAPERIARRQAPEPGCQS